MPEFIVEQYELHVQKYRVTAMDRVEAVRAVLDGAGTAIDNSGEYIQPAEFYGRPAFSEDERQRLRLAGVPISGHENKEFVPTIRSVEEE